MLLAEVNSEASRGRGSRSRAIVAREGGGLGRKVSNSVRNPIRGRFGVA